MPRPPWDPPIIQDKITGLSGNDRWQGLCEVNGYWSNFEVFIQVPQQWTEVQLRAVVTEMDLSTEVARKRVGDIEHPELGRAIAFGGGLGGVIQGSIMRITGRPCAKFSLQARALDGLARPNGKFYIRAAPPTSITGDQNDRIQNDPFAGRHQQLNASLIVPAGVTAIPFTPAALLTEATARSDRIYITGLSITSHDDAVRVLSVQTRNVSSTVVTIRRDYLVGGDATRAIATQETFSYPLRPDRDDIWEVALNGTNLSGHRLNITGFAE